MGPMTGKPGKTSMMTIRLTAQQRQDLERIALETGVEVSQLIRMAIEALLKHYRAHGNKLTLPLDFSDSVQSYLMVAEDQSSLAPPKPQKKGK